jgi:hypothetical protein
LQENQPARRQYSALTKNDLQALYAECNILEKGNLKTGNVEDHVEELNIDESFYRQWEIIMSTAVRSVTPFS